MVRLTNILSTASKKWDIMASVVLTRPAVIAPSMTEIEQKFHRLQTIEEHEKSLKNNYELKSIQDQRIIARREELLSQGKELSELDEEISVMNSVREDEWNKKAEDLDKKYNFSTSSSVTDEKSIERCLDRKLVLIVKQKFGDSSYSSPWIFPQMINKPGESLRQTVQRCIGEVTNGDLNVRIAGNAPFSMFTHRYPKPIVEKTGAHGAKIFFYLATLGQNTTELKLNTENVADYSWMTQEEFWSKVPGREYKMASRFAFIE